MRILSRFKVLALGIVTGALFSGCCVIIQLPSSWSAGDKFVGWLWFMSGPFCLFEMGVFESHHPVVDACVKLGFLGMLLLPRHSIRPSAITAAVTILGFLLWFLASFIIVIMAVWGA